MQHNKYYIFVLIITVIFTFSESYASFQNPKAELSGFVSDSITGEKLPYATVIIYPVSDSSLQKGVITNNDGKFIINDIDYGVYKLIVSYMSYIKKEISIDIIAKNNKLDVLLSPANYDLSEVLITGEKRLIENTIEKTTVNISKDISLIAGTALDALQTVPSVDVDFDGIINYRGSNRVMVLINGEKSSLVNALGQMPADAIQKIEIISNPAAKYDAEGMSGIINIILKSGQPDRKSTNILLNTGYHDLYGGSAGFSKSIGNLGLFINAALNHKGVFQTKEHYRANYENPDAPDYYQFDSLQDKRNNGLINANLNYKINNKNNIGVTGVFTRVINSTGRNIDYITYDKSGLQEDEYFKNIKIDLDNYGIDAKINYNRSFSKKGRQLKIISGYSVFNQTQEMKHQLLHELNTDIPELQNTISEQLNKGFNLSSDYTYRLNDSIMFEVGYKGSIQSIQNDFTSISYNYNLIDWFDDTELINNFRYDQYINALYFDYNRKYNFLDIQAGLRTEYTITTQNNKKNSDYLSFFPTVSLSKKINKKNTIYTGFNRRINRPTIKMLNPYTDEYADILNMHQGNPDLEPEFVNSFEIGNRFIYNKKSGSFSVYYRDIKQAISRIKSAKNDSALIVSFINLDKVEMLGGDFILSLQPYKWWTINAGGNVFFTRLTGVLENNIIDNNKFAWNTELSTQIKLPKDISIQISGYYRSKLPLTLGMVRERHYVDFALNKKVLKGNGRLVLKISDIFNTYKFGMDLEAIDINNFRYSQSNRRKIESRYFILSFSYNLNGKGQQKKADKAQFFLDSFEK